jgi:hypothetical protein
MSDTFRLHVTLTGLLISVINEDLDSKARLCSLLVDARKPTKGLDGLKLAPHRGFIRFPLDSLVNLPPGAEDHVGVWYLGRQRLIFQVEDVPTPTGEPSNPFIVEKLDLKPGEPHPVKPAAGQEFSFTWVLDMNKVFPDFDLDERLFDATPPPDSVLAQIIFDRGRVLTQKLTPVAWNYDTTLSGQPYQQEFAHEAVVMMDNVTSAKLLVVDFDHPENTQTIDLSQFKKDGDVKITIVNVCEKNPLQWPIPIEITPDVDSKWFFQLMPQSLKDTVVEKLSKDNKNLELPIPHPIPGSGGLGAQGSGNCIKTKALSRKFRVKELD